MPWLGPSNRAFTPTAALPNIWETGTINEPLTVGTPATIVLQGGTPASPNLAQDPSGSGATLAFSVASNQQTPPGGYTQGLPPGVTLNTSTGQLTGTPTTSGNYAYTLTATTGGSAMADWLTRSQGSGVVWAQLFQGQSDVSKYIVYGGSSLAGIVPTYTSFNLGGGILGAPYGSLLKTTPANDNGAFVGKGSWNKPFSPIAGVDVNKAGVATISDFSQIQDSGVWGNTNLGGYFAQNSTSNTIGNEFWIQMRVKFSANRANNAIPYGKFFFITVNNLGTPDQEIVADIDTRYGDAGGGPDGHVFLYTNGGNAFNSFLGIPQDAGGGSGGDSFQPGSTWSSTCSLAGSGSKYFGPSTGNCFCYPMGQWFTLMYHVKPGASHTSLGPQNTADTLIECFIAPQGATSFTTVFSAYQQMQFQSQDSANTLGWNILSCQDFTGGPSEVVSPQTFTHEWDQIILSTQAIPCPQV
jgi:Putative Ig domain